MAVVTPSNLQISTAAALAMPSMAGPLGNALKNINYLHRYHQPPMIDACPSTAGGLNRQSQFVVPCKPSADGVKYNLESRIVCSQACNLTLKIDYTTAYVFGGGVWTSLVDHSGGGAIAVGGAGLVTQVDSAIVIPAAAVALRWTVQADAGVITPQHWLAYPAPAAPLVADYPYPSGFTLYDDGMFGSAQKSAVHTELLNRCAASAFAIRRDRWQQVFSWVQEESQGNCVLYRDSQTDWLALPPVRCGLPGQALAAGATVGLQVGVIASVDAGATTSLIRIAQVAGEPINVALNSTIFSADSSLTWKSLTVTPQGSGLLRYVDLAVSVATKAGKKCYPHAVVASWRPGD